MSANSKKIIIKFNKKKKKNLKYNKTKKTFSKVLQKKSTTTINFPCFHPKLTQLFYLKFQLKRALRVP